MTEYFTLDVIARDQKGLVVKQLKDSSLQGCLLFSEMVCGPDPGIAHQFTVGSHLTARLSGHQSGRYKLPTYTQRKELSIGSEMDVVVESEDDKHLKVRGEDGCQYYVIKRVWERGPKYRPVAPGTTIKVVREMQGAWEGFLTRLEVSNPYFIPADEIILDRQVLAWTFHHWREAYGEDTSETFSGSYRKLYEDYDHGNANWILSYATCLSHEIHRSLVRQDLKTVVLLVATAIHVEEWIRDSGFLLTQTGERRSKSAISVNKRLDQFRIFQECLDIVKDVAHVTQFLGELRKVLLSHEGRTDKELRKYVNAASFVLSFLPVDYFDDSLFRTLLTEMESHELLFSEEESAEQIRFVAGIRRKQLRKKMVETAEFGGVTSRRFDPETLEQFIFLQEFEIKVCRYRGEDDQANLEELNLQLLRANFANDKQEKEDLLRAGLEGVALLKPDKAVEGDTERHDAWRYSRWNLLARYYEELAATQNMRKESIVFLRNAADYYRRCRSRRAHLLSFYVEYLDICEAFPETPDEVWRARINEHLEMLISELSFDNARAELRILKDFYRIVVLFGTELTMDMRTWLLQMSHDSIYPQLAGLPLVTGMARVVLANDLLASVTKDTSILRSQLASYLSVGEFRLQLPTEDPTEVAEEDDVEKSPFFGEESETLEFKGTLCIDVKRLIAMGELTRSAGVLHDFLKAIVGMLNRNGGTIFVGILEGEKFDDNEYRKLEALGAIRKQNRIFLGIAFELKAVGKTKDEHMRHIAQTLRSRISNDVTSFVSIDVTSAFGVELYRVTIQPYPYVEGVCLDGKEYFVRENNETLSKSAPEFIKIRLLSGKGLTRITETPTPVAE
jgi:hypothetical protein